MSGSHALQVSVAMCTYNGAEYLRAQLDSIAAQSRLPDELVICDDCSTDQTREILEDFARTAPFRVAVHLNDQNVGSSRNFEQAIKRCSGDVIALSDQDDIWHPDKLKWAEDQFLNDPDVSLVFTNGDVVDENLKPLGWTIWQLIRFGEKEQSLFRAGRAFEVLLDHNVVTGATTAFRSGFRDLVLPIPTDVVHDGWKVIHDGWLALMISATSKIAFTPTPLLKYRQHQNQQIGVRNVLQPAPIPKRAGLAESAFRRNSFDTELHYFETIWQRLSDHQDRFPSTESMAELKARITHFKTRAALPTSRFKRIPLVFREFRKLRYHRYSNGVYSATKDLFQST